MSNRPGSMFGAARWALCGLASSSAFLLVGCGIWTGLASGNGISLNGYSNERVSSSAQGQQGTGADAQGTVEPIVDRATRYDVKLGIAPMNAEPVDLKSTAGIKAISPGGKSTERTDVGTRAIDPKIAMPMVDRANR